MTEISSRALRERARYSLLPACVVGIAAVAALIALQTGAGAAATPVGLGTASTFGVLAGSTVTNTGMSMINGDLGLSPGTSVTGIPPGVVNGTEHITDLVAAGAQSDLTVAYNDAASQAPTATLTSGRIGAGQTLTSGVYKAPSSLFVRGALTLDGGGDPSAVFVFQIPSTLITASDTTITLIGDASPCNVFWQVGSSATVATGTTFQGSILALTSITVQTGDTITGRALARNAAVTLDDDTINVPSCPTASPSPSPTVSPSPTISPTVSPSPTISPTVSPSPTISPTVSPSPSPSPSPGRHHHRHRRRAPRPTPVPTTLPVTG